MPRKRKPSKKVRAKRIYKRLYTRLLAHHNAAVAALRSGDIRRQARESALFTKTIARACVVERLSGEPWDVNKFLTPHG